MSAVKHLPNFTRNMSAVSVYSSGIFFLFRGYRKSSIKPSKGLFISKPFERGLNGNGGVGGGAYLKGGGGLNLFRKFGTILNFQATRGWYQFSIRPGRKVETQAYVERGIAAERSKQIRTSSIWIKHDTTVISPSLIKLVGKNKDGSALCVWRCFNQLVMWLTMIDVTNGVTDGATDHAAIVITS